MIVIALILIEKYSNYEIHFYDCSIENLYDFNYIIYL